MAFVRKWEKYERTPLQWEDIKEQKFINYLMKNGKKTVATKIYAMVLKEIKSNGHMNPNAVIDAAIENTSPEIMVKSKRIWGSIYQVPVEVKSNKKLYYAIKRLLESARGKKGKSMYKSLAEEVLAAYAGQGNAVRKKDDAHKMAEANKAFAHMAKYIK